MSQLYAESINVMIQIMYLNKTSFQNSEQPMEAYPSLLGEVVDTIR